MVSKEQRKEKALQMSEELWDLYNSIELGGFIKSTANRNELQSTIDLADTIGDTILGFHHSKDLPQLLQKEVGLSADEAQRVVRDLGEFLTPVLEREASEMDKKQAEIKELEQQFAAKDVPIGEEGEAQEENDDSPHDDGEPHEIHEVVPMRTMKGDMQRIHGYGAYREQYPTEANKDTDPVVKSEQDTVLKKQPLVETPKVDE